MKTKLVLVSLVTLASVGCTGSFMSEVPKIPGNAPIANAGNDLETAVAQATQAYIDAKGGNANFAWSVKEAMDAYQLYVKTKGDVQAVVQQWSDGSAAGKSFAQNLATLFGSATGAPAAKAAAVAKGVQKAALAAPGP